MLKGGQHRAYLTYFTAIFHPFRALSNGTLLSAFSASNTTGNPKALAANHVLISADHGKSWTVGGPTPEPVDNAQKPWGESSVAELAKQALSRSP